jgi:hypothetical protein
MAASDRKTLCPSGNLIAHGVRSVVVKAPVVFPGTFGSGVAVRREDCRKLSGRSLRSVEVASHKMAWIGLEIDFLNRIFRPFDFSMDDCFKGSLRGLRP